MTTRSMPRTRASGDRKDGEDKPKSFLQMMIVYPTLFVAVLTAAPQWVDRISALVTGITDEDRQASELFTRNMSCMRQDFEYQTIEDLQVNATVCPSGVVMIRAFRGAEYRDSNLRIQFVDANALASRTEASLAPLFMAAVASEGPQVPQSRPEPTAELLLAQSTVEVMCVQPSDERYLVQQVRVEGVCYDETIDTFTGALVDRREVPCVSTCS